MKKIIILLVISIGLIGLVYYELENDKATSYAAAEAEKSAIFDAELEAFEADLLAKLALKEKEVEIAKQASLDAFQQKLADDKAAAVASTAAYQDSLLDAEFNAFEAKLAAELTAQEMMAEIETEMARQVLLDAFQQKLADDKAAAAKSTAAYQDSLLDAEFNAFEAKLAAELTAQEMMAEIETEMARQALLDAFQQKLADDKAAAAKSTAAYQSKRANDARIAALMAKLASQEMMVEIETEMARQASLDAFQQKLADDKAAAAASTSAYQAKLVSEAIEREIDEFEAQLMEDLLEESTGIEITITGETHNLCRSTLGLSETNIQLFKKALSGKYLFSIGPQGENGTEFSSTRWDGYISCISSLNNEL